MCRGGGTMLQVMPHIPPALMVSDWAVQEDVVMALSSLPARFRGSVKWASSFFICSCEI